VPQFTWDVQLPGEDLPRQVTTDYLVNEGDTISVDGRDWIVEGVEMDPGDELVSSGVVRVETP
jgi:hypothetical protein